MSLIYCCWHRYPGSVFIYWHVVDLHINVFFLSQKEANKATAVSQVLEAFLALKPKLRITTKFNKQHPAGQLSLYYTVPNLSFALKCL